MKITEKTNSILLAAVLLGGSAAEVSAGLNLLPNGSFETYSCDALGCSFEDWSMPLGWGSADTDDKTDGEVALLFGPAAINSILDNAVSLSDYYYAPGTEFTITLHYKVLTVSAGNTLSLDCYWEPEAGGDAEAMYRHDAEQLQAAIPSEVTGEWTSLSVTTSKPSGSARLRVRVLIPKKSKVLFDAFSVEEAAPAADEPYIRISPVKLTAVSTILGTPVNFTTLHIEQGNTTGTTTFELSGYQKDMFRLSATAMDAGTGETELVITYSPTQAGTHTAVLNIDNLNHTTLFKSVQLTGTCIDPAQKASIQVIPSSLSGFEAVVGEEMRDTFTVITQNCSDFAYMRVNHIKGAAFTIDGSMVAKNATTKIQARFAPLEPGEYESTVTVYSEGADSVVMTLHGVAAPRDESTIDWQTSFIWDESNPLKLMNETFERVDHNKTVVLKGWQNVADVNERPWWGFDEAKTSPIRGDGKYAKATAYQYGKDETKDWESWLVTPALDYKNAKGKIFAFSVMGEYMPEIDSPTLLEIYYVEVREKKAYFQNLTESFIFPTTGDENNVWRTYFLDLAPYAETMADVFHIAFRYKGPNGGAGAVTYYLDNISWGRTDLPVIRANTTMIIDSTAVTGQKKVLGEIEVTGQNLTNEIYISVGGANYNRFSVSPTSLPATGGTFTVSFTGQESGVHEAYVVLSSSGAPDTFIPMAVLCRAAQGLDQVQRDKGQSTKVLRDGQLYLMYKGTMYDVQGRRVDFAK